MAGGRQDRERRARVCAILGCVAVLSIAPAAAEPGPRPPPPPRLSACSFTVPDDVGEPRLAAELGDAATEDTVEEDEGGGPGESPEGIQVGPDSCLVLGLSLENGVTVSRAWGRAARLLHLKGPFWQWSSKVDLDLTHMARTEAGDVVTHVEFEWLNGAGLSLSRGSVRVGAVVAGLEPSLFDAWTADEFSYRSLASSQSPTLVAVTPWRGDHAAATLSLESADFRNVTVSGYGGTRWPDLVGRLRYDTAFARFTLTGALRHTGLTRPGAAPLDGYAVQASMRVPLSDGAEDSYAVLQGAYADNALGFLGIATRGSIFAVTLPGIFGADIAERGRGWNLVGAVSRRWSERWRTGAFLSGVDLRLDRTAGTGRVQSLRGAANVTFTPVEGLDFALEAGWARLVSGVPLLPSATSASLIATVTRSF